MLRYEELKQLAKAQKRRVTDLIALAPQNDPFYCGAPADREQAEWFRDLWDRFGFTSGVHLRRIHYRIISQATPIRFSNGTPYENTENCWKALNAASKAARYLGLVDPEAFVDRRNPDPALYAYYGDATPAVYVREGDWSYELTLPDLGNLPDFEVSGYTGGWREGQTLQPYHLEVWCEKTTMNDVLLPVCERYGVNLVTGAGELSITAVMDLLQRVERAARPAHLFYISDFDPAGLGMPISIARKVEFFHALRDGLDVEITLDPLVLSREQVQAYRLPRTPIKDTDGRKLRFEERFGDGAVELDALEALHPGELAKLLRRAIREYHDPDIGAAAERQREALREDLDAQREAILAEYRETIDGIETEYEELRGEFAERVSELGQRWDTLGTTIRERLEAVEVDLDEYPVPVSQVHVGSNGTLFDSTRDYLTQLDYYQRRREGTSDGS